MSLVVFSPLSAMAGGPLTGFADCTFPGQHWAYFDSNGHAYNIFWTPAGGYAVDDATAASGAPPAAPDSPLTGFADCTFPGQHWAYFGSNGHAYNIFWTPARGYGVDDVTAASGAPPAPPGSPLTAFADCTFPGQHWAYFGSNGHAYNIFWTPARGYAVDDVTAASGAPAAPPGSPLTAFADSVPFPGQHWAYFDSNGHLYNIFWTPAGGYRVEDATAGSGAPPPAPGSPLIGFTEVARPGDRPWQHWAYFDSNGHAYNIFRTPVGVYAMRDATAASGAPPAAPGSPLTGFVPQHWAYFDSNGHAYNIFGTQSEDATAASGAPSAAPGSPLTAFVNSGVPYGQHWAYLDSDGHAYNIFWTFTGGYAVDDATAASGAPPAR
jgi:hypothetical protein